MRFSFSAALVATALTLLSHPATAADVWRIDPARTRIAFTIDSTAWPRTSGAFTRFDGRLSLDFERPARSSVRFTVQAASVEVGSKGLNDYIRSAVFFDAQNHPTMIFSSTSVEKIDERTARIAGDLTLLGVTKPATFTVVIDRARRGGAVVGLTARGRIMRSQFGMNSGVPLISDAVDLVVTTEAAAQ